MQSADSSYLARSKSAGPEKKAPPPIRPKPSTLASAPTDTTAPPPPSTASSQRTSITVTDDGAPTSSSFGDLKKAFERQQNSSPLFLGGVGASASPSRTPGRGISSGHASHASISRVQQQGSSSLAAPLQNSRPRSVSSPAPPLRENEKSDADASGGGQKDGIDNSQPDFSNLRARFQSQASLSSVSQPKAVREPLVLQWLSACPMQGRPVLKLISIHAHDIFHPACIVLICVGRAKTTTQARHQFAKAHSSRHYSTASAGSSNVVGFSQYPFIDITAKLASAPLNIRICAIIIIASIVQLFKASPSTSSTDEAFIICQDTYTA